MLRAVGRQHILAQVAGGQVVVIAQGLAGSDQFGVVLEAGQVLAGLQQAAAQVAFARAPVEPVAWWLAEGQAPSEGFDLLPFAAWHVDVQAVAGRVQAGVGQFADGGQLQGLGGQLREGCRGRQLLKVLLGGLGLLQGAVAQPGGEFGMLGFPLQA